MPLKSLFSLYPHLKACPLALVSWRNAEGQVCWDVVEWVGVVCARPSRLSFSLTGEKNVRQGLSQAGVFAISLPDDERLCNLRHGCKELPWVTGAPLPEGFSFVEPETAGAPFLFDCPVTFTCSLQGLRADHGKLHVGGVVRELRIQGQIHSLESGTDLCNLQPFNRRWFLGDVPPRESGVLT